MMNNQIIKEENLKWLGKVPPDWSLVKLRKHFIERRQKVDDISFPPLSVTMNGVVDQMANVAKSDDSNNRKLVKKNDIVINSRSDRKGASGISPRDGSVSLISIVLEPKNIDPKYSEYLFKSYYFKEEFFRNGSGIHFDLWTTPFDRMRQIIIPYPNLNEQSLIVSFLDKKLKPIDNLIEIFEKKIILLKEFRTSVINQYITKGINEDIKKVSSDVEWIKTIPMNWETKKLKYLVKQIKNKHSPESDEIKISPEYVESDTGVCFNLYSEHTGDGYKFIKGDILINKLRIYLKKALLVDFEGTSIGEMIVLRTVDKVLAEYIYNSFFSDNLIDYLNSMSTGVKVPRVSPDAILSTKFPIPPTDEMKKINKIIKDNNHNVEEKILIEKNKIKLLKEYKQSLISNVVTGKYRVKI